MFRVGSGSHFIQALFTSGTRARLNFTNNVRHDWGCGRGGCTDDSRAVGAVLRTGHWEAGGD